MPEMQTIVTDVHGVCLSVCHECTEWPRLGFTVWGNRRRRVQCMPRAVCKESLGAAFAKCLWPLVVLSLQYMQIVQKYNFANYSSVLQFSICYHMTSTYGYNSKLNNSRASKHSKVAIYYQNRKTFYSIYFCIFIYFQSNFAISIGQTSTQQ